VRQTSLENTNVAVFLQKVFVIILDVETRKSFRLRHKMLTNKWQKQQHYFLANMCIITDQCALFPVQRHYSFTVEFIIANKPSEGKKACKTKSRPDL
jgi:hypothetical protein